MSAPSSPPDLVQSLRETGYLCDPGLGMVAWLAITMHRPLLLEGEPGTGKTALAQAVAQSLGANLIRLQCYEGIDASQALYDWDFPRQVLHLRAVEATGAPADAQAVEESLYDERFLLDRPILKALRQPNSVLLIDEIDRADDEFEAFLLEVLSTFTVSIPEFGTVSAKTPPVVILTSNRTRDVHDALKRRCLYHWLEHPSLAREIEILRTRHPEVSAHLAEQVATASGRLRGTLSGGPQTPLLKPPGVAESLDWVAALQALGTTDLDLETAAATLGVICKYREDADRVRDSLDRLLAG